MASEGAGAKTEKPPATPVWDIAQRCPDPPTASAVLLNATSAEPARVFD